MDGTDGFGADCGVEAVGFQAHDPAGQEHPEMVLDNLVKVVRATGHIGVVGCMCRRIPMRPLRRRSRDGSRSTTDWPSTRASASLEEAVDAYDKFDKRIDGYTKVLLHPATR